MLNDISRRSAVAGLLAGSVTLALPHSALALTTAEARDLIDRLVGDINRVINSGMSEQQMYGEFKKIFVKYADVPIIARSALGIPARSASAAQMQAFTAAFLDYISRKYGKRFREFIGGELKVEDARPIKSFYEVKTTAFLKGEAPFDVTFLVSNKSGRNLFFNMYIEGVNMLASERTEIGAMLDRRGGDLDQMVQDLKTAG